MQDGGQKRTEGINQEGKLNETPKVHPVAASALKTLEKAQLLASIQQDLMAELSGSEEGEVSEVSLLMREMSFIIPVLICGNMCQEK